jgi:hypothetical protein
MKDKELQVNRSWRFVNIKPGTKVPWQQGWQTHPLELENIYSESVGLVVGPLSNGICAIDFDGIEAWEHFDKTFNKDILSTQTVAFSSGKPYRLQLLFKVPEQYWDVLKKKVVNKLELRWSGCQSVLPPSIHPDTKEPYIWLYKPSEYTVKDIPDYLLEYWLDLVLKDYTKYDNVSVPQYTTNRDNYSAEIVNELLENIKHKVGNLQGDYDVWRTIAWATCSEIGMNDAKMLLQYHWPYKTKKELKTLLAYKQNVGPKIGTLIKLSGLNSEQVRQLEQKYNYVRPNRILSTKEAIRSLYKKPKIY